MNPARALSDDDFYSRTLWRIQRLIIILGIAGLITSFPYFGWRVAAGFGLGCTIAFLNFHSLQKVVAGIGELAVRSGAPVSSRGIVTRFLFRYFLMAIVAFVILVVSRESLYGLFAGLLLPVSAMLCEAAYEGCRALFRGM